MIKLSVRLQTIINLIEQDYQHIWDACCDHGLLGQALLQRQSSNVVLADRTVIHFVDVVPELMAQLETRLFQQMADHRHHWRVHCQDVAQLDLLSFPPKDRHLIILAGVGGDLMIELIQNILSQFESPLADQLSNMTFLLCPVYHHYRVRTFLSKQGFGLEEECLVEDKGRMYEVFRVSIGAKHAISLTGDLMWDLTNAAHLRYLKKTIQHYQQVARKTPNALAIADAYQALLETSLPTAN